MLHDPESAVCFSEVSCIVVEQVDLQMPLHTPLRHANTGMPLQRLLLMQAITRVIEAQDQLVESAKLGTNATPAAKA